MPFERIVGSREEQPRIWPSLVAAPCASKATHQAEDGEREGEEVLLLCHLLLGPSVVYRVKQGIPEKWEEERGQRRH